MFNINITNNNNNNNNNDSGFKDDIRNQISRESRMSAPVRPRMQAASPNPRIHAVPSMEFCRKIRSPNIYTYIYIYIEREIYIEG